MSNSMLNHSYTFDSFILGNSNKMACKASLLTVKESVSNFNPLFIYGGTGISKTHLLQAIGNDCIELGKDVIYVTCEQFMNDFTSNIKKKTMDNFRNKYRHYMKSLI